MNAPSRVSRALKLVRQFHDLSQTDLARRLGISKSYLSELEAGKKSPTMELLGKYSEEFSLPASTLMLFAERLDGNLSPRQNDTIDKLMRLLEWAAEDADDRD
jgi:transcriptional regulator with XRE-family HTH domain